MLWLLVRHLTRASAHCGSYILVRVAPDSPRRAAEPLGRRAVVARMGKRRGGGGDYEDQYGGGWSGGHRDFGGEFRGGHGGGGGGTGGGDAGGGKPGSGVTYQRQLPKFLQQHAYLLGTKQEVAQQREEFSQLTEKLSKYGDEDDVASAARRGLGSHDTPAVNRKADAMSKAFGISAEDEEQKRMSHEEKAKGNRAFSEKRYEDAVKHFTLCMKLDPKNPVFFSNRSAAHLALKVLQTVRLQTYFSTHLCSDFPGF